MFKNIIFIFILQINTIDGKIQVLDSTTKIFVNDYPNLLTALWYIVNIITWYITGYLIILLIEYYAVSIHESSTRCSKSWINSKLATGKIDDNHDSIEMFKGSLGNPVEAIEMFTLAAQSYEIKANNASLGCECNYTVIPGYSYENAGDAYKEAGNSEKAAEMFEKAILSFEQEISKF